MDRDEQARIATDIGSHAAMEMMRTMMRVLGTAPPGARTACLAVCLGTVQHKIDGMFKIGDNEQSAVALKRAFDGVRETLNATSESVINDINNGKIDPAAFAEVRRMFGEI